jgi:hypothetical protein
MCTLLKPVYNIKLGVRLPIYITIRDRYSTVYRSLFTFTGGR